MMITKKLKFSKISTWPTIPVLLHHQIVIISVVFGCFFNVVQNARLPKGMFSLLHLQIVVLSVVLGCFFNVVQNARLPKGMFSLRLEMKDRSAFGGKSCE